MQRRSTRPIMLLALLCAALIFVARRPISAAESDLDNASKPNIVYFHVDNLGMGELGCYGGGVLRGAKTPRIDAFAKRGMKLLNYAPESQCTPSRLALMTGRYSIRSGTHTVALAGSDGGLVAWERTIATPFRPRIRNIVCWQMAHRELRRALANRPRI